MLIFSFSKSVWSEAIFVLVETSSWKIWKTWPFHLYEDHQFRVNIQNTGIWQHSTYTSKQALINWIYLCHERSIISILYFMQSVQDNLTHVFTKPIGFTKESILKEVISRHCCGLGFWVKDWAKWAAKYSKLLSYSTFWATSWKYCSIIFSVIWVFPT